MRLSIIIPTKDRAEILQRTIDNLVHAVDRIEAEIIIINDSKHEVILREKNDKVRVINNAKSGASSARNLGVKNASGNLLLFLDDDIIVNSSNIHSTFQLHANKTKVGFNFFWLYPPALIETLPKSSLGRYILARLLFSSSYRLKIRGKGEGLIKTEGLTSQYFSILKSDFLLAGGYDENIPYAGIEDILLYGELKKNGIEVFISPGDVVFQNESDRLVLFSIMERARRGAITMRIAVEMGYDVKITTTTTKKIVYSLISYFKPLIYKFTKAIPNRKYFDFIYFKFVNILLGLSFYQGYYRGKSQIKH